MKVYLSEVIIMDKLSLSLIGIGVLGLSQYLSGFNIEGKAVNREAKEEQDMEYTMPGIALDEFVSKRYGIEFKYPKSWSKNPRYEDKYEGASGFFEVGDFAGVGETIDEAVKMQIDESYRPYGSNPVVRSFTVDGEPARVIYPSKDQSAFYNDRETAIVVKYPKPREIDGVLYDYVVIWVSKEYVPLILSTFKFVNES